jgi:hypothetical protein
VVAEVKERLSVSKRAVRNFATEIFNRKKATKSGRTDCNYQVKLSNRFATLKNLDDRWTSTENGKVSKYIEIRIIMS